jgi:hypothetical protein
MDSMKTSLEPSTSIPSSSPIDFETTGTAYRVNAVERPIGRARGETGVARLPRIKAALSTVMEKGEPSIVDQALEASWRQLLGSSPVVEHKDLFSDQYGWDQRVIGIQAPTTDDQDARDAMIDLLDIALAPTRADAVTIELARLKASTVGRAATDVDLDAWLVAIGDAIEAYPIDIVRAACRHLAIAQKWTPALAEIVAKCEALAVYRRHMRRTLSPKPAPRGNGPRLLGDFTRALMAEYPHTKAV